MLADPISGFTESLQQKIRTPNGKVTIKSHAIITATFSDGHVVCNYGNIYSQRIIPSTDITIKYIDFFLARESGNESDLDVRILGDVGGLPDTGTVIASAPLFGLTNIRPSWYRVQFQTAPMLSEGVSYWIELTPNGDTSVKWFSFSNSAGSGYALNASSSTSGQTLILKLLSTNSSENEYQIPNVQGFQFSLTKKMQSDSGSIELSNLSGIFGEGQPIRHLLVSGNQISFYIGNGEAWLKKGTMVIDSVDQIAAKTISVNLLGINSILLDQKVQFKSSYIGIDFCDVVYDLLRQAYSVLGTSFYFDAGETFDAGMFLDSGSGNFVQTGLNFPEDGTLSGTISEAIQKICDATGFIFFHDESGEPNFIPRNENFSPVFSFDFEKNILFSQTRISESKQDIINRVRVDNGKTSDSFEITIDTATSQGLFTGNISNSTKKISVTCSFSDPPILGAFMVNNSPNSAQVNILQRNINAITFDVLNLNYPNDSADYDFEVFGSTISNYSLNLIVEESENFVSTQKNGTRDFSITNDLFLDSAKLKRFLDEVLLYNSSPREFLRIGTIGIPVIQNMDIVSILHPKIREDFIYKVQSQSIQFSNEPIQLKIDYELERYPFLLGDSISSSFFYFDSGESFDSGLFLDSEINAYQKIYN